MGVTPGVLVAERDVAVEEVTQRLRSAAASRRRPEFLGRGDRRSPPSWVHALREPGQGRVPPCSGPGHLAADPGGLAVTFAFGVRTRKEGQDTVLALLPDWRARSLRLRSPTGDYHWVLVQPVVGGLAASHAPAAVDPCVYLVPPVEAALSWIQKQLPLGEADAM